MTSPVFFYAGKLEKNFFCDTLSVDVFKFLYPQ